MYFKRKAYNELLNWKKSYAGDYAVLVEGARRVGKSTVVEQFARNEYKSYILVNFATESDDVISCFDDINDLDMFFLRLQAVKNVKLIKGDSVIIFDEVQLFPKARQAIKNLVNDKRYHYIETGSLISIKKNAKDILIPSEEMKIQMHPMDFEEFLSATGKDFSLIGELYKTGKSVGQSVNKALMKDFRVYMAVGGMPQSVKAYIDGKSFAEIDMVKRQIITLYEDDFKKLDPSGRVFMIYKSIPGQLSKGSKKYSISKAIEKRKTGKSESLLYDLIDSKTVNVAYDTFNPIVSLSSTKNLDSYKLYLADTGLFVTLMFIDRPVAENTIYAKLMADKLPANLGYLYENAVSQMITASGRELYYHTFEKTGSTHYYELDFLISENDKVSVIEVKSSGAGRHESISEFKRKYGKNMKNGYIISQKDVAYSDGLNYLPVYMAPFILSQTGRSNTSWLTAACRRR